MSQENVEIVRAWMWAFENDRSSFQDALHPEIEWCPYEENHSPSYGHEGAMRIRDEWIAAWDEHRIDLEEIGGAGESIVASVHITARGDTSGVEVDVWLHLQFRIREGKVAYVYEHRAKTEALEAAGLSE